MNQDHSSEAAAFLTGLTVGLRALADRDIRDAQLWYEREPPLNNAEFGKELRRAESIPWGGNPVIRLIVVDLLSGAVMGGLVVTRSQNRTSRLEVTCRLPGSRRATVLREVLPMVVSWLINEVGLMTVVVETAADDEMMVLAAEDAGMTIAVRRREHLARPSGRTDLLLMERVNREWGRYAG